MRTDIRVILFFHLLLFFLAGSSYAVSDDLIKASKPYPESPPEVFNGSIPQQSALSQNDCTCLNLPIMHPSWETAQEWERIHFAALRPYLPPRLGAPPPGSLSLLDYLDYVPQERDQGTCGNCWVWGGTGILEIALNVQRKIKKRLSIQYLNSCAFSCAKCPKDCCSACCGGSLESLEKFYGMSFQAVPWSNADAGWQDGTKRCKIARKGLPVDSCSSFRKPCNDPPGISCDSIATSPNYPIVEIGYRPFLPATQRLSQAESIALIKEELDRKKGVYFAFCLPTGRDWDHFGCFWSRFGENHIWDLDRVHGTTLDGGFGCHGVLCVGYNDLDPNNSYWVMLNSWGDADGRRPNGTFRINMNMDYNLSLYNPVQSNRLSAFRWETLIVRFADGNSTAQLGSIRP